MHGRCTHLRRVLQTTRGHSIRPPHAATFVVAVQRPSGGLWAALSASASCARYRGATSTAQRLATGRFATTRSAHMENGMARPHAECSVAAPLSSGRGVRIPNAPTGWTFCGRGEGQSSRPDAPADADPVHRDRLVADRPDGAGRHHQSEVPDLRGVPEVVEGLPPGEYGGQPDHHHHEQAGEVLSAAEPVGEAA